MKTIISNPKTLLALAAVSALLSGAGFKVLADTTDYSQIPGMPKIELMTGNDRWGCEVLLCLANPNGPRAVSECRPPIDKLFDCLSWRHPCKFPSCPMAGDGNYAKQLSDGFDPCILQGMEDAPQGWIVEGNINDNNQFKTDRRKNKLLRKIMPATTGAVSTGSKQPRTLPDIGEALRLALRAIKALPMRVTPVMTARETAAVLPFATALSASMNR